MPSDLIEAQRLLEQQDFAKAGELLKNIFATSEFIDEQEGSAYLAVYAAYANALTRARQEYHQALDVGIALLKAAKNREREMSDGLDLARLEGEISALQQNRSGGDLGF